ncbi:MAG: prepilin-type N-terminal cleavage/methylation domain-containing protein [Candidatus Eisenbacteria sp.]|nr:prepilin-type N-terminal cleavage/methylation domain-containing protein [Candidatus Eisenbacteria bacterium]
MKRWGEAGFTLLELVMVIVIIGILGAVAVRSADLTLDRNRYYATVEEMKTLGHAIAGNPDLVSAGRRTDFGYVGDMGSLPGNLDALVTSQGGTWNGPYVVNPLGEDAYAYKTDGWGQAYTYPVSGAKYKILSGGGGESITYQFANSEAELTSNTVFGTITDWNGSNPTVSDLSNITVTVRHPSGGSMTSTSATPSAGGVFSITGIPIGIRRVVVTHSALADSAVKYATVTPGCNVSVELRLNATLPGTEAGGGSSTSLVYVPGTAEAKGGGNRDIIFWIQNASSAPVALTSMTPVYTVTPTAYYKQIKVGLTSVWSQNNPRQGSGEETTFNQTKAIVGGGSTWIEIKEFKDARSGGSNVNMGNVDFEITFSDGSVVEFTTAP